jgi:prepilin-type N-terminal cleavage/methylation domain-containing protein
MRTAQKAFTLIELLIVISIITIITGALLPSFNSYIDAQNVKQSQEQIEDDLRTLQNKALNGESASLEIDVAGTPTQVEFWGAQFSLGLHKYITFVSTSDAVCPPNAYSLVKSSSILPGNSKIMYPITGCVFFSFENGDATFVGGADTLIVGPPDADFAHETCRRVVISSNGLIVSRNISSDEDDNCSP